MEKFHTEKAEEFIRDKFSKGGIDMRFSHYHKYEFYWESEGDLDFVVHASYGGDPDRIYRYPVTCGDVNKYRTFEALKNAFTFIQILDNNRKELYTYDEG